MAKKLVRIAPHKKARAGVKCKHCSKRHTTSAHWSHTVRHTKKWHGRADRPQTRAQRSAANKRSHAAKRARAGKKHLVRGHLAANAGRKPGKHRVRAHLAKKPARRKKASSLPRTRHSS